MAACATVPSTTSRSPGGTAKPKKPLSSNLSRPISHAPVAWFNAPLSSPKEKTPMQKSCPQPLDFYHRRVSCHRYRGHPRRAARHRGAYRGRRDDRRPRRGRRGRETIAAVVPDRSGRRAPSARARLRGRFRLQHAVLPRPATARAARRPAERHRFDLGPDPPGRQRVVVGDPLPLAQGQADAQSPRPQGLRAGPSSAAEPRPLGERRPAGRHLLDGRHRQHHTGVRRRREALRHRGRAARRRMGLHQPVDRAGHHTGADARRRHGARHCRAH